MKMLGAAVADIGVLSAPRADDCVSVVRSCRLTTDWEPAARDRIVPIVGEEKGFRQERGCELALADGALADFWCELQPG